MIIHKLVKYKNRLLYSVWEYLLRLTLLVAIIYIYFTLLGNNTNQLSSFIASSIAFLLATVFATIILLKETKWIFFFVFAYIVKVFIGLVHYLYFIDADYFNGNGEYKSLTTEFEAVFDGISSFAIFKMESSLFFFESLSSGVTHQELLSFISIPFMFFGNFVLTISPVNAFFSLLISINILLIAKYKFNFSNKNLKYVAFITAYFPITLISSLLWRDVVGMSLMTIGITLLYFSKRSLSQYLFLIIACYLFYLQRTTYPFILALAFFTNNILASQFKIRQLNLFFKVLSIVFFIYLMTFIFSFGNTEANSNLLENTLNLNLLALPLKFVLGLIGPFPWTNFLIYESFPAYAYQLQDYLQGTFNVAFVFIMFRNKFFRKENINLLNLIGVFLIISGLTNIYMHISYVSFGFMFLIPWLFTVINLKEFKRIYMLAFMSLIVLNLIVVLILGNLGISSLWR